MHAAKIPQTPQVERIKRKHAYEVTRYQFSNASIHANKSKMIKKERKGNVCKERIQTSAWRQIDTVRNTSGSAATIISRSPAFPSTRSRREGRSIATRPAVLSAARISSGEFERQRKRKKERKKTSTEVESEVERSTGKIYAKRRRTRSGLSSIIRPEKAPRAFSSFRARRPLPLPLRPPPHPGRPRRHGLIENSIILFLSTG